MYKISYQTRGLTLLSLCYVVCLGTAASDSEKNSIPQLSRTWSWAGSETLRKSQKLCYSCWFFPLLPHPWNAATLSVQTRILQELIPKGDLLPQRARPHKNASPAIRTGCWWLKEVSQGLYWCHYSCLTQNLDPSEKLGRLDIYWNIWMKHYFKRQFSC